MQRLEVTLLRALLLFLFLVPLSSNAFAESRTIPVQLNGSYIFTNGGSLNVNVTAAGGAYDCIVYKSDGTENGSANSTRLGSISIPAGGSAIVTVTELDSANVAMGFVIPLTDFYAAPRANPALLNQRAAVGESYEFTNNDLVTRKFKKSQTGKYDYAIYDVEAKLTGFSLSDTASSIDIPAQGTVVVTVRETGTDNAYVLFSGAFDSFKCKGIAEQALTRQDISINRSYIFKNSDIYEHSLKCDPYALGNIYDYACYYKDGSEKSGDILCSTRSIDVPTGGYAVITVRDLKAPLTSLAFGGSSRYFSVEESTNTALVSEKINLDDSYIFTNTSVGSRKIFIDEAGDGRLDYFVYDGEGLEKDARIRSSEGFVVVPGGGRIVVTVRSAGTSGNNLEVGGAYEGFTVSHSDQAAMPVQKLKLNESILYTNNDDIKKHKVYTYYETGTLFDYAVYNRDGSCYIAYLSTSMGSVEIPEGGTCVITVKLLPDELGHLELGASELFMSSEDSSDPALCVVVLGLGESCTFTNTGLKSCFVQCKRANADDKLSIVDSLGNPLKDKKDIASCPPISGGDTMIVKVTKLSGAGSCMEFGGAYKLIHADVPTIRFEKDKCSVPEDGGPLNFIVKREGVTDTAVTVNYRVTGGTAIEGTDFSDGSGTISFAEGETEKTISMPIIDNAVNNYNKTLVIDLYNYSSDSRMGFIRSMNVTIVDDEADPPIVSENPTLEETGKVLSIRFDKLMSNPAGKAASFTVTVNGMPVKISAATLGDDTSYIRLTLEQALYREDIIQVAYTGSAGDITSEEGGVLGVFDENKYPVINKSILTNLSHSKDILSFEVTGQVGDSVIDNDNHTVTFLMPAGATVTLLKPVITVSQNASVNPASGTPVNFRSPVTYTVTAQDKSTQKWVVTCNIQKPIRSIVAEKDKFVMAPGTTEHVVIRVVYKDDTTENVTGACTWESSDNSVATVEAGVITCHAQGKAVITVTYGIQSTRITVESKMKKLSASIKKLSLQEGETRDIILNASFGDDMAADVAADADWSSSNTSVVTVNGGRVTCISLGKATITATYCGKTVKIAFDSAIKKLVPNIKSIKTSPDKTTKLTLTATLQDGTLRDVTDEAVWTTEDSGVAVVENGEVTCLSAGKTKITATFGGKTIKITVDSSLKKLTVTPKSVKEMHVDSAIELSLTAVYADGSTADLTGSAVWTSSNAAVAYVKDGQICSCKTLDKKTTVTLTTIINKKKITIKVTVLP